MKRIYVLQGGESISGTDMHMADLVLHRRSYSNRQFEVRKSRIGDHTDKSVDFSEIGKLVQEVVQGFPEIKVGAVYRLNTSDVYCICAGVRFATDLFQMIDLKTGHQYFPDGAVPASELEDCGFVKVADSTVEFFAKC